MKQFILQSLVAKPEFPREVSAGRTSMNDYLHLMATVLPIIVSDIAALAISSLTIVWARYRYGEPYELSHYLRLWPALGVFVVAFAVSDLYPGIVMNPVDEIRRIFRAITFSFLFLSATTFLIRTGFEYSRFVFLAAWIVAIICTISARTAVRFALSDTDWWGFRAVIFGYGETGRLVARALSRQKMLGLRVIAAFDDVRTDSPDTSSGAPPLVGTLADAASFAYQHEATYAIIAMPAVRGSALGRIIENYASEFKHIIIIPDLFGVSSLAVRAKDLGGILALEENNQLLRTVPRLLKRAIDMTCGGLSLIVLSPLLLLIGALVALTSKGPVLYGDKRYGLSGKLFKAWKFRTMEVNATETLTQYLRTNPEGRLEWESARKLKHDPRVTRIGRLLRRSSLDELPQLWNILIGEMSLVGPRPVMTNELEKYGDRFALCSSVRPGLSGWWQISGRNDTTFEERIALNEYYVRNWSIWLDIYILCRTMPVVISGRGAY